MQRQSAHAGSSGHFSHPAVTCTKANITGPFAGTQKNVTKSPQRQLTVNKITGRMGEPRNKQQS